MISLKKNSDFFSLCEHSIARIAMVNPIVNLANPKKNAEKIIELSKNAEKQGAAVALFPELSLTGYSLDDVFFQSDLITQTLDSLRFILDKTAKDNITILLGAPLVWRSGLFNCALILQSGSVLGVVPKSYLPNYREFYEKRHFRSGAEVPSGSQITMLDMSAPFGTDLIFIADNNPNFTFGTEICEDLWVPTPPSSSLAMGGANVIFNLSASNVTLGKSKTRKTLCESQSLRSICAYAFCAAGEGESTNDLAWDGHSFVYELGQLLVENKRFSSIDSMSIADIDLERITNERLRVGSFNDCKNFNKASNCFRWLHFSPENKKPTKKLARPVERFPFIPSSLEEYNILCEEAFSIQVKGLKTRLKAASIDRVVIGISGGLDSLLAVLVAVQTFDDLGLDRKNIIGVSMPGYATSDQTAEAADEIMSALNIDKHTIDIRAASLQMFQDISHPFSNGNPTYDITFENVQAGARTSLLFRLANKNKALVVGTGDLSELALGWCTYGVGDQMSHYNVNCAVPKTLVKHLINWIAQHRNFNENLKTVCKSVTNFDISPELVPPTKHGVQKTEDNIGPYELHDFFLFHTIRFGLSPEKILFLAYHSWSQNTEEGWPPEYKEEQKNIYSMAELEKWLKIFLKKFYQESQFKRTAVPNGPKLTSGGSLSPRGDWRMPSDLNLIVKK